MSAHAYKFLSIPLSLVSAALLIHDAAAADLQQQMRELLSGTTMIHAAPRSQGRDQPLERRLDTQEYARRVLLGITDQPVRISGDAAKRAQHRAASAAQARAASPSSSPDIQIAVQNFLLGKGSSSAHGI